MSCACWLPFRSDRPVDKRDRAILMLFVAYGLRAGEVVGLRLDDLDWENEMHSRSLPEARTNPCLATLTETSAMPFCATYGKPVRPVSGAASSSHRMRPSDRLARKTLGKIVRDRLAGIGIVSGRRGTHALRHAAAQHLLDQGMSMKVIGDFLGHRDPSSTAIYAKVNLAALREVAALDLEGLA